MIFKELKLSSRGLENYVILGSSDEKILKNLSKINIFVGQNNSGKSRFLRGLSMFEEYEFIPKDFDYDGATQFANEAVKRIDEILKNHNSNTLGDIQSKFLSAVQPNSFFKPKNNSLHRLDELFSYISRTTLNNVPHNGQNMERCVETLKTYVTSQRETLNKYLEELKDKDSGKYVRMYVPVMRGLRPPRVGNHNDDDYFNRTNSDYYGGSVGSGDLTNNQIFSGLSLYENIRKRLLGSQEERKLVRDFEIFLSENFFDGEPITLIPAHDADVLTVSIGKIENKRIYELGDGIQSLIILNYPIFEFVRSRPKDSLLVFIEEPELYVHPGLQRKLLEQWQKSGYEKVQFFVTTHSNHFLDMTIDFSDMSIFKISLHGYNESYKENEFVVENLSSGDKSLLESLGVRNSSVFLSNATIWVEGISDRIYFRKFLELYLKKKGESLTYLEDTHYSFVEYGGGNLPHWSFDEDGSDDDSIDVSRIVSNIYLVADRDDTETNTSSAKAKRLAHLKKILGPKNSTVLPVRETENLITFELLSKVIASRGDSLKEKLKLDTVREKLKSEYLGHYIESKLLVGDPKKRYCSSTSKTIKNKASFAKEVCEQLKSFDELSDGAKKLTRSLYRFIVKTNTDE
ncbi:AAA family ATPase [Candidatus Kaiserbacteria bacterium]|nr:AAA family ATPase [Candidatus Kaiserbacteria bacterium]